MNSKAAIALASSLALYGVDSFSSSNKRLRVPGRDASVASMTKMSLTVLVGKRSRAVGQVHCEGLL